jgi:hypothetical protein
MTVYGGAWVVSFGGVLWSLYHTPADETCYIQIPLITLLNPQAGKGARLISVDVHWDEVVAELDSLTPTLIQSILPVQDGVADVNSIAFDYDAGNNTAAERRDVRVHKMTMTLNDPAYPASSDDWYVELAIDFKINSAFYLIGAQANYVIRD